jgi:H+-transporting ATPase
MDPDDPENPAFNSFLVAKGDPRSVIRLCVEREDEVLVNKIEAIVKAQCSRGRSVVAIAKGKAASMHILEHGPPTHLNLVGLLCVDGTILSDTSDALVDGFMMGLNIKLITNDSVATGSSLGNKLGIGANVITIEDYLANDPSTGGKGIDLEKTDGFAEVTPENRIHLALATAGISTESFVDPTKTAETSKVEKRPLRPLWGLTSTDPSVLYEADLGITHRNEVDVATQSADVVLMQPGFHGLIRAIKKARKCLTVLEGLAIVCAVQSLRNIITLVAAWVTYGFQPIPTTSLTILVGLNLPMLLAVAHFDRGRLTKRVPSHFMIRRVGFTTAVVTLFEVIAAFLLGVLVYDVKIRKLTASEADTGAFLWFALANGFIILLCRSPSGIVFRRPWPHPLVLGIIFISQLIATILSVGGFGMTKISILNALLVWAYTIVFFLIQNIVFYATRLVWNTQLLPILHSQSWFLMYHKSISEKRWYRGLLTG